MIPKSEWDAYNKSVDSICSKAQAAAIRAVGTAVHAGELSGMGIAEVREQVKAVLEPVILAFSEAASELAAEWYDAEAEGHGYKLPAAVTCVDGCGDVVDSTVRYQIRKLMDGDAEGFARACGALARDAAARQLNATIIANAKRDKGSGVRFARVTTGRETCAFCYMLASRGAVYHTRETAGQFSHYHRNCDCKVVPGFEDDPDAELVEGHDPAIMRERMALIEEQAGLSFSSRDDLSKLSREIGSRDPGWLYGTVTLEPRFQDGAAPNDFELKTAVKLSENGYQCVFRRTRDAEMLKTSDVFIVGNDGEVEWDFKCPTGNGRQTVYHQFEEAAGQAHCVVIDFRQAGDAYSDGKFTADMVKGFIKYHYKITSGIDKGNEWGFTEAIAILKDGSLKKIVR